MRYLADAEPLEFDGGVHTFDGDVFSGDTTPVVVWLKRAEVRFRGCRFEGGRNRGLVIQGGKAHLEGCTFADSSVGLWASEGAEVALRDCRFEGPGSLGVGVSSGAYASLEGCSFVGCRDACVLVRLGSTASLVRSQFELINCGLLVEADSELTAEDCDLRGGLVSVHVHRGARASVLGCRLSGARSVGLAWDGSGRAVDTQITDAMMGVCLGPGADPDVSGGAIVGGMLGVYARAMASGRLHGIRVDCTTAAVLVDGCQTVIDCDGVIALHTPR